MALRNSEGALINKEDDGVLTSKVADEEQIAAVKRKLKAAAYDNGCVNWEKLFKYYDKDNTGEINFEEFKAAIRKDAKVKADDVSDDQLKTLFDFVDTSGDGVVHYEEEFIPWLDPYGDEGGQVKIPTWFKPKPKPKPSMKKGPLVEHIKRKLRAAAFDNGAVNWHKLFRYYDKDNSGEISFQEFRAAMRRDAKIKVDEVSDEQLLVLFKHIDLDGDDVVAYEAEFLHWLDPHGEDAKKLEKERERIEKMKANSAKPAKINPHGQEVQIIKKKLKAGAFADGGVNWEKLFRYYDKDNSGYISFEEFRSAIRKDAKVSQLQFSERKLQALFAFLDQDSDGAVQFETEFLKWLDPRAANQIREEKAMKKAEEEFEELKVLQAFGGGFGEAFEEALGDAMAPVRSQKGVLSAIGNLKSNAGLSVQIKKGDSGPKSALTPEIIMDIKNKLRSLAYHNGKLNWQKLFRYYDRDNSGKMAWEEFNKAVRKDAKLPVDVVSDKDLRILFREIDIDNDNVLEFEGEFVQWLEDIDPEGSKKKIKFSVAPDFAHPSSLRLEEIGLLAQANAAFSKAHAMLPFLLRWINYTIGDVGRCTEENFTHELQNGLIMIDVVKTLIPHVELGLGINMRPNSRPMCIKNLEKALWAACRNGLNRANMCQAKHFYEGRVMQMARGLTEMFDTMQMRPVKHRFKKLLKEIGAVLSPMGRPLLDKTLEEPLLNGYYLLTDFGDCTRVMALLLAANKITPKELAELYGNAKTPEQMLHNARVTNRTLASLALPTLLLESEWANPPGMNIDVLVLEIHELWMRLRNEDQVSTFDLAKFQFKDREPLSMNARQQRAQTTKAYEATRKAHEGEPDLPPLSKGARIFGQQIQNLEYYDNDPWKYFDVSGDGEISMTEFADGARRIGFKGNVKKIFMLIDSNRSGQIDREEFFAFCKAAAKPMSEEDLAREAAFEEMDKIERQKSKQAKKKERKARKRDVTDSVLLSAGITEFIRLINSFPTIDAAFDAFDTHDGGTITLTEFEEAAVKLGMQHDAKKIFGEMDLNRSGIIDRNEFKQLVKDVMKAHDHWMHQGPPIELLVENPLTYNKEWPSPPIFELTWIQGFGDLQFPSAAQERAAMMLEEFRRNKELLEDDDELGELLTAKGQAALLSIDETDQTRGMQSLVIPDDGNFDVPGANFSTRMAATTSLSARVMCTDSSEQPVWLQTAVVDRLGEVAPQNSNTAFVLEVRQRCGSVSRLVAQLDVQFIHSIEQLQSGAESMDPSDDYDITFTLSASPGANLGGSQLEAPLDESKNLFHYGIDDASVLHLLAGPSAWRRREAMQFFDELRLIAHFLRAANTAKSPEKKQKGMLPYYKPNKGI